MKYQILTVLIGLLYFPVLAVGPGVPAITFGENELFKTLGHLVPDGVTDYTKAGSGYGTMMLHGYLVAPLLSSSGGWVFFDISDPKKPKMVARDGDHAGSREQHAISISNRNGKIYAATLQSKGIAIRDWSDINKTKIVAMVDLPGIPNGDYNGAWWNFWQGRYIYVGGGPGGGFYIVDAADPENPKFKKRFSGSDLGMEAAGEVLAVGNILYVQENSKYRPVFIYENSDPLNPRLLSVVTPKNKKYSFMVNGDKMFTAENGAYQAYDISVPSEPKHLYGKSTNSTFKGAYMVVQDDYVLFGNSGNVLKFKISDGELVGTYVPPIDGDLDFVQVIGNMVTAGDDHGHGVTLFPHAISPDRTAPSVNMISPLKGATRQALTTAIGMTFTDQIDPMSIGSETIKIQTESGAVVNGYYSVQTGIVSFYPEKDFLPNTTYTINVEGVKDYSGNALTKRFSSSFSTGSSITVQINAKKIQVITPENLLFGLSVPGYRRNVAGRLLAIIPTAYSN